MDYNGRLSLEQFEKLIKPVVDRMDAPILRALKDAGVTKEQLGSVEIVGGATRYIQCMPSFAGNLAGGSRASICFLFFTAP